MGHGRYDVASLMTQSLTFACRGGAYITLQQPPLAEPLEALGVEGMFFVVRSTPAGLNRVRESVEQGHLRVTVAATYPSSEERQAFESASLPVRSPGKTVLIVRDGD